MIVFITRYKDAKDRNYSNDVFGEIHFNVRDVICQIYVMLRKRTNILKSKADIIFLSILFHAVLFNFFIIKKIETL